MTDFEKVQNIVAESQFARVGNVTIDLFTAGYILSVHKALKPENKAKLETMSGFQLLGMAMRLMAR